MPSLWYGTSGPRHARIVIVGEAWGAEEARQRKPFVGESGRVLDKILQDSGLNRAEIFCTNIVPEQPPNNKFYKFFIPTKEAKESGIEPTNGLFPADNVKTGLANLYRQVEEIKPDLIVGCGNYPLWAFSTSVDITNTTNRRDRGRVEEEAGWKKPAGIGKWRGSQMLTDVGVHNYRYLALYHPAAVMRNWPTRPITVHDLRTRVPIARQGKWTKPVKHYIVPPSLKDVFKYLNRLEARLDNQPTPVVVDLETKRKQVITCVGFTYDGLSSICIPFLYPKSGKFESYWPFSDELAIVRKLRKVMNHPNFLPIGQNYLYDSQYLKRWWYIKPRVHFDTMLAQHVMFPGTPKSLAYLASLYNDVFYRFWKEDDEEWEANEDLEQHLTYNCDDCFETWVVWKAQVDSLSRLEMQDQYAFMLKVWQLAFDMMDFGIPIDREVRAKMTEEVIEASTERQAWLKRVVPEWTLPAVKKGAKPWYTSPIQQRRLFYEEMGLKAVYHKDTGNPTANDDALQELKLRYPELTQIIDHLSELRSLGVFQNNFLSAAIDPDNRMRCSFNFTPETFRWSSSENAFGRGTNLQNIPKGDEK